MKNPILRASKGAWRYALVATSLSLGVTSPLYAQDNDSGTNMNTLEEIVVTARQREERIQDIPLAITAFSKEDLKRKSIGDLDDVARYTPGLSFEDFSGGFATAVVRGQTQNSITSLEQNVSVFFDRLFIPRSWAVDIGTASVERIEVVKGPQSARYGRNAFSGAINYIPTKASLGGEKITGNFDITLGSDERQDIGGFVEIPLGEKFAAAASFSTSEFDGSWENLHPFANANIGTDRSTTGNVGGWDNSSFSLSVAGELTNAWDFDLAFYNFEQQNEARAGRSYDHNFNVDVFNCGGTQFGNQLLVCGDIPDAADDVTLDPRGYGVHSDTDILRFSTGYEISDTWSVEYLYGKIEGDTDIGTSTEPDPVACGTIIGPPTFAALCNFQSAPIGSIEYETHDIRVNYESDSIRAAFGLFVSDGEDDFNFVSFNIPPLLDENNFAPLAGQVVPSFNFDPGPFNLPLITALTDTDVQSLFAEIGWTSPDSVTRLGAEVRYSETEVTLNSALVENYDVITPRFTYERDLSDDRLLYATVARGAKTGGFNPGAIAPENQTFDEEFNWTYEGGLKATFLNGTWALNSSIFYTDWTDVQINSVDPDSDDPNSTSIVLNLGNADVLGVEFDTQYRASQNLTFDGTLSFTNGSYKDGTFDQRFARPARFGSPACDDVVCNSNGDIGGNDIERTPSTQASVGAQWEADFSRGNYYVRGDLSWQNAFYASTVNVAEIPSRSLLNLRGGMTFDNGISVDAWVKNVTDEAYVSNSFVILTPFNNQYSGFFGHRRTLGLSATYRF